LNDLAAHYGLPREESMTIVMHYFPLPLWRQSQRHVVCIVGVPVWVTTGEAQDIVRPINQSDGSQKGWL
jgi:hypothetical protein